MKSLIAVVPPDNCTAKDCECVVKIVSPDVREYVTGYEGVHPVCVICPAFKLTHKIKEREVAGLRKECCKVGFATAQAQLMAGFLAVALEEKDANKN
jgi:hypothetical protein